MKRQRSTASEAVVYGAKKAKKSPPEPQEQDASMEDGEGWTKVEKRKTKKLKKTDAKHNANPPAFMYAKGEIQKRKEAISIGDIRDFVLHIVADSPPVGWIRVENSRSVQKVVALLIPGLTSTLFGLPPLPTSATSNPNLPISLPLPPETAVFATVDDDPGDRTEEAAARLGGVPFIPKTFSHACPTKAPGEPTRMHSVLSAFFHGPVSSEEKKKRVMNRIAAERALSKDPTQYLLTVDQMIENDYPLPSYVADVFEKPPGWVETPEQPDADDSPSPKIYAMDCEMCVTEDGRELTRVCLIDYNSKKVVYDQLVKPDKPIIDYLTRFSGITAEALEPVTTKLTDVQTRLLELLSVSPTPILLGHSLESDLRSLKLCHPRCIDTAIIFHHPRGRPLKPGLAWLTKKWCGREIQTRGEGGHNPEEDARACLDLLRKKVENGPSFGEFKTDLESIFERMARSGGHAGTGSIRSAVVDHGNPSTWHGSKATTTVPCTTDEEVYRGLVDAIPSHQFVFGRFTQLADALGWVTPKANADPLLPSNPPTKSQPQLSTVLPALNQYLTDLHGSLPPRTALIIFSGHSDPRRMSALNAKRSAFEATLKTSRAMDAVMTGSWTTQDGRDLEEEVERAKRGLVFVGVKNVGM